jgi:ketosteroid isomerase-like protein
VSLSHTELATRAFGAFRDNDLGALLAVYHPDAEITFEHWEGFPESTVYRGHAGVEQVLEMMRDVFGEFEPRLMEMHEVGGGRVLAKVVVIGQGMASGVEVEATIWQIVHHRDGLIWSVDTYGDEDAARAAAGLVGGSR